MTTYLRFFNYDEAFKFYCGLIDKMLQVFFFKQKTAYEITR